jgi:Family of unknown function (DUF6125)
MKQISDKQAVEYFRRSYTTADGLWFMKVEDTFDFETALEIDHQVWKVLPKIQARMIKSMLSLDNGLQGLYEGITTRLTLEGFEFEAEMRNAGFKIMVKKCPWHELMLKSGREHLSEKVSSLICPTENSVWASEFGNIQFRLDKQMCKSCEHCVLQFGIPP